MRLQRYLAQCGVASRREAEKLIEERRVAVNGEVVSTQGTQVDPDRDRVQVDGRDVQVQPTVVLLLNKPRGVLCTARDPEGRPTIYELIPPSLAHLTYVGRLDFDTSGVLLLTNDGELSRRLTLPEFQVEREYLATVENTPEDAELALLEQGIEVDGERLVAKSAQRITSGRTSRIRLVLTEGRNREVRRMLGALNYHVLRLMRSRFAFLELADLPAGELRRLTNDEERRLRELVGL